MIDLLRFCEEEWGAHPVLCRPYRRDGHIYATDGKVAVRVPDDGRDLESPGDVLKLGDSARAEALAALEKLAVKVDVGFRKRIAAAGKECAIPSLPDPTYYTCGECKGEGRVEGETCLECHGKGCHEQDYSLIRVGGVVFHSWALRLIGELPGLKLRIDGTRLRDPQPFTFDGGDGLIMGVEPKPGFAIYGEPEQQPASGG